MKYILLSTFPLFLFSNAFTQSDKAKELVSKMSLEQKVNMAVGMGMKIPGVNSNNGPVVGQTMDKVPGAAGTTFSISQLGLPATVVADGPAGLRIEPIRNNDSSKTYYATGWPVATLLASTWDTELVEKVGQAMGNEVKEYGVDVILGPALNIQRNPLGGRNFEYYSEDPLVSGKMAAAMVKGIQSNGVGTSIKHFVANNQETNRYSVNTIVSERALREIYLKGFEIAVKESNPWTVMSSYNLVNGTYTSENYDLLNTILRKEWKFKGIVMTDWFGGKDAVAQMKAGNDLLMPGIPAQKQAITDAVKNGSLDIKILDENVAHIVDYILNTQSYKNYPFSNKPDLSAHAKIARSAAAEGMVLLKNSSNTLPLKNGEKVAAFGNTSYAFIAGGTGSGNVNKAYTVSLAQGLTGSGFLMDDELKNLYQNHLNDYNKKNPKKGFIAEIMNPTAPAPELSISKDLVERESEQTDIALITIGRNAGEGRDRKKENDFYLSGAEKELIKKVTEAYHAKGKKVVVIVNAGGVIDIASWSNDADAILLTWQGGQESGNAVADILSGNVNPSGKLAVTIPVKYEDDPTAKNFPGIEFPEKAAMNMMGRKAIPGEVTYEEGIYVGYRYYNSFKVKPAYEFGYGLSYTNFDYSNFQLSSNLFNKKILVTADITNSGKIAGKEVVQLYISAPSGELEKPSEELKGFVKTKLLSPGETQKVSFEITADDLASYSTDSTAWIADPGKYIVKIGASSTDIKLIGNFELTNKIVTEKCHKVLIPQVKMNEKHQ